MDMMGAIENRHSVRDYTDKKLEPDVISQLQEEISLCNAKSGLHMQPVTDEPDAFIGCPGPFYYLQKQNKFLQS